MHLSTVEKRSAVQNLTKESTAATAAAAFSAVPDWVRRIFTLVEFRKKKIEKFCRYGSVLNVERDTIASMRPAGQCRGLNRLVSVQLTKRRRRGFLSDVCDVYSDN